MEQIFIKDKIHDLRGIYEGPEIWIIFPSEFRGYEESLDSYITLDLDVCADGCSDLRPEDIAHVLEVQMKIDRLSFIRV